MPSTREIRRRIKSRQEHLSQITRAMEMIAASRMRRAQLAVLAGRPYAESRLDEVISKPGGAHEQRWKTTSAHPLLQRTRHDQEGRRGPHHGGSKGCAAA